MAHIWVEARRIDPGNTIITLDPVRKREQKHKVRDVQVTHRNYVHIDGVCYDALDQVEIEWG